MPVHPSSTDRVYRRVNREGSDAFRIDGPTLNLLMELDGRRSLGDIALATGQRADLLAERISRLVGLRLAEEVRPEVPRLDEEFLHGLQRAFALAVGPIASIIIEDTMADLGHGPDAFPIRRAPDLVDMLAREIQREDKKVEFTQTMLGALRALRA